jgi:hypothetical protein
MKDLYLETKDGRARIDAITAEKYSLEPGDLSPFTQNPIVGRNGEQNSNEAPGTDSEAYIRQDFNDMPMKGIEGDDVDQMENGFQFSQSEIIDFSQGVDSRMDENR